MDRKRPAQDRLNPSNKTPLRNRRAAMVGTLLTLAALSACQSPFKQQQQTGSDYGNYADSVIARAVVDGTLNTQPATAAQGVNEMGAGNRAPDTNTAAVSPGENPQDLPPSPTPQASREAATLGLAEPSYSLSLQDAIERALKHNLAIKAEGYSPGIREAQITQEQARIFDPVLFWNSTWNNTNQPQLQSFSNNSSQNWSNTVGVRKTVGTGGTLQASAGDAYQDASSGALFNVNPSHSANVRVEADQPLLRGFGPDITHASVYIAQRDARIARSTFRRQTIDQLRQLEEAYYNLIFARGNLEIQERLAANTEDTYNRVRARAEFDVSSVELNQAQARWELAKAQVVRARGDFRNASDRVKALINDPALDLQGNTLILPADKPIDLPMVYNVGEQVSLALQQRAEMREARLNIEKADILINAAKNDLLPRADITVAAQSNGLDNGFDQAFGSTLNAAKFIDYSAGLKFEMPIGNREKEAQLRVRTLQRKQTLTQMLSQAQQVVLDVKTTLRDVLTSYQEIAARQRARVFAARQVGALLTRENVGEKLNFNFLLVKLDAQERLAQAEQQELQAIVTYNIAIIRLEQAKGTLLEYNRISLEPLPREEKNSKLRLRLLGESYPNDPREP